MLGKIKAVYQLLRAFFEAFENGKNKVFHDKFQKCFFFKKKQKIQRIYWRSGKIYKNKQSRG